MTMQIGSKPPSRPSAPPAAGDTPPAQEAQPPRGHSDASKFVRATPRIVPVARSREADLDPITHVRVLSSDAMGGRDSPSPGLERAGRYIIDMAKHYGLSGGNPDGRDPFRQPFVVWRFKQPIAHPAVRGFAAHNMLRATPFGQGLFPNPSPEQWQLIAASAAQRGIRASTFKELKRHLTLAGTVDNVVARLEGTGPNKNHAIVLMAHYDHVGTHGGEIFNGADDNASGTALLLSLIPYLAEAQRRGELDRSIVFLWTAAEEKGLLGAEHFVASPPKGIALDQIDGVINVDMVGRQGPDHMSFFAETNGAPNYLDAMVEEANRRAGQPFAWLNRDVAAYQRRQDGYPFARLGLPTTFLFEGLSNPRGGGDINPDYHSPRDILAAMLGENGGAKIRNMQRLAQELVVLASNTTWQREQ